MADYRIQCWTTQHRSYVGIGILWTILFPFGIPAGMLYFMWRCRVPELAKWKSDCAWLRSIVQRAMIIGASPRSESFDPDSITTESISLEHLRVLHGLFVVPATTAAEELYKAKTAKPKALEHISSQENRTQAVNGGDHRALTALTVRHRTEGQTVRFLGDVPDSETPKSDAAPQREEVEVNGADAVAADEIPEDHEVHEDDQLPDSNGIEAEPTARQLMSGTLITSGALGVPPATRLALLHSQAADATPAAAPSPVVRRRWSTRLQRGGRGSTLRPASENWFVAFFRRVQEEIGLEVSRMATQRAKTLRRTLTSMLYSNERSLLLHSLLEWAKHDKHCLVSEPRHNQMRWRTHHEWQALKLGNIVLGDHDGAERAGTSRMPHVGAPLSRMPPLRSVLQIQLLVQRLLSSRVVLVRDCGVLNFMSTRFASHAACSREIVDLGHKLFLTSLSTPPAAMVPLVRLR